MSRRMNRRANRANKANKANKANNKKREKLEQWAWGLENDINSVPGLQPFIADGVKIFPVEMSAASAASNAPLANPKDDAPVLMDMNQLKRQMHTMTDEELNKLMYMQAKDAVENGTMEAWPEDDFGVVMWFMFSFITPEMREAFPEIAKEYIDHEEMVRRGDSFDNIPYPRSNEKHWEDAYYYRLLGIMIHAARRGSSYSRNFLISLYKVYYKREYNRLKRLKTVTFLEFLEMFDEDCREHGYASSHSSVQYGDKGASFKEQTIERRRHEAGWMDVFGDRFLSPVPEGKIETNEELEQAASMVRHIAAAPDEPPLQPVASRIFIMCEMLGIEIDETCNRQAVMMNEELGSMLALEFLGGTDYRGAFRDVTDRAKAWIKATYPEMADPYLYQTDERFFHLQIAEEILTKAFMTYGRNVRIPYESRKFDLPNLISKMLVTIDMDFPGYSPGFGETLYLAMIQYLSECLCDVMIARDEEVEELLHFHRMIHRGEWAAKAGQDISEEGVEKTADARQEKVLRAVTATAGISTGVSQGTSKDAPKDAPKDTYAAGDAAKNTERKKGDKESAADADDLRAEIENLKAQLAEKEAALVESEQKTIRQRVLYEKAHRNEKELQENAKRYESEHEELVALREYVYGLKIEDETGQEIEEDQDAMIEALQDKRVAVLGGIERWSKKMHRLLPGWSFIAVDDNSIGAVNALESADYIYIYTNALKHDQYYRAMNIIRSGNKMLYYLGSTNVEENIKKFYNDLCRGAVRGV